MRIVQLGVRKQRCARRGFTLIEIVVAIAIIAMVSGGIAVAVIKKKQQADISLTRTNAQEIRAGVKSWWLTHDSGSCPNIKMLMADGELEKSKSVEHDAWQQPWRLKCDESDITVQSNGPDKLPETEDDIRVPNG